MPVLVLDFTKTLQMLFTFAQVLQRNFLIISLPAVARLGFTIVRMGTMLMSFGDGKVFVSTGGYLTEFFLIVSIVWKNAGSTTMVNAILRYASEVFSVSPFLLIIQH